MRTVAVIVTRKGSKRVPNKMHRRIGNETLLERKMRQLREANCFDEIVVGTDDLSVLKTVMQAGNTFIERAPEFCDEVSRTPNDMVKDMCMRIRGDEIIDVIVWAHLTNPFIGPKEYREALAAYNESGCDSVFCATAIQSHFWFGDRPLNFNPNLDVHQVAKDLEPVYMQNGGIFIRPRMQMALDGKFLGRNPRMYVVDELTGWDINDEWQMKVAAQLGE